jgi:hypothetical protein
MRSHLADLVTLADLARDLCRLGACLALAGAELAGLLWLAGLL